MAMSRDTKPTAELRRDIIAAAAMLSEVMLGTLVVHLML
jgi:hypothetical protein